MRDTPTPEAVGRDREAGRRRAAQRPADQHERSRDRRRRASDDVAREPERSEQVGATAVVGAPSSSRARRPSGRARRPARRASASTPRSFGPRPCHSSTCPAARAAHGRRPGGQARTPRSPRFSSLRGAQNHPPVASLPQPQRHEASRDERAVRHPEPGEGGVERTRRPARTERIRPTRRVPPRRGSGRRRRRSARRRARRRRQTAAGSTATTSSAGTRASCTAVSGVNRRASSGEPAARSDGRDEPVADAPGDHAPGERPGARGVPGAERAAGQGLPGDRDRVEPERQEGHHRRRDLLGGQRHVAQIGGDRGGQDERGPQRSGAHEQRNAVAPGADDGTDLAGGSTHVRSERGARRPRRARPRPPTGRSPCRWPRRRCRGRTRRRAPG